MLNLRKYDQRRYNRTHLTEPLVQQLLCRAFYDAWTYKELSEEYGISHHTVAKIVRRELWRQVEEPEGFVRYMEWLNDRRKATDMISTPGTATLLQGK